MPVERRGVASTTANGRYRFTNLQAGPITLCFQEIKVTEYSRCYSSVAGGTTDPLKASRLTLTAGMTLRGVDFEYPRVRGGISGRVLLDGQAIDSDEHFAVVDLRDARGTVIDTAAPFGTFTFQELAAGIYFLRVHGGGDLGEGLGSEYSKYDKDAETSAEAVPIVHRRGQDQKGFVLDLTTD